MAAASEPSAQQSGIDNVPGVPEAMCRPQRLGPRQPACRTLGRDRPRSPRLLLSDPGGRIDADSTGPRSGPRRQRRTCV